MADPYRVPLYLLRLWRRHLGLSRGWAVRIQLCPRTWTWLCLVRSARRVSAVRRAGAPDEQQPQHTQHRASGVAAHSAPQKIHRIRRLVGGSATDGSRRQPAATTVRQPCGREASFPPRFGHRTVTARIGHYSKVTGKECGRGLDLGRCSGWLAGRLRRMGGLPAYRGLPVPTELPRRAKRKAVRLSRDRMTHLETPARYSGYTGGGDGGGGDRKPASFEPSGASAPPSGSRWNGRRRPVKGSTEGGVA